MYFQINQKLAAGVARPPAQGGRFRCPWRAAPVLDPPAWSSPDGWPQQHTVMCEGLGNTTDWGLLNPKWEKQGAYMTGLNQTETLHPQVSELLGQAGFFWNSDPLVAVAAPLTQTLIGRQWKCLRCWKWHRALEAMHWALCTVYYSLGIMHRVLFTRHYALSTMY